MRKLCLVLCVVACPALVWAARPPQSVLVAKRSSGCACACRVCNCTAPGDCGDPACGCAGKSARKAVKRGEVCPCGCGCRDCQCVDGDCGGPNCGCPDSKRVMARFYQKCRQAIDENKPLLVWVRVTCVPCEFKMPNYIHAHVIAYEGYSGVETDNCVLVFKPDGLGGMNKVGKLPGIPTPEEVQEALTPKPQMAYTPPPMMMAPPMMMGGFGGGFGGGCGGGG